MYEEKKERTIHPSIHTITNHQHHHEKTMDPVGLPFPSTLHKSAEATTGAMLSSKKIPSTSTY
jgi:hypothetical protein